MKADLVRVNWVLFQVPRSSPEVIWLCPLCGSAVCHLGWRIFQSLSNCDNGELAISFWDNVAHSCAHSLIRLFLYSCIHLWAYLSGRRKSEFSALQVPSHGFGFCSLQSYGRSFLSSEDNSDIWGPHSCNLEYLPSYWEAPHFLSLSAVGPRIVI